MKVMTCCDHCQKQYDVTGFKEGEILHCVCGHTITRTKPKVNAARIVRCPNCGGAVDSGKNSCAYCGSTFSLSDKGWGSMCPKCYGRLPNDAKFCVSCGIPIQTVQLRDRTSEHKCPRCKVALHIREMGPMHIDECGACGGIWTPIEHFEGIVAQKQEAQDATSAYLGITRKKRRRFELSAKEQVQYIPCPVCSQVMNRRNFGGGSGVIIDSCREHGVWLDNQELSRIVKFMESGGRDRALQYQAERRETAPFKPMGDFKAVQPEPLSHGDILFQALNAVVQFLS